MAETTGVRSQDQIVARIADLDASGEDFFGFAHEVLIEALDYEHAKPYLNPNVGAVEWDQARPVDLEVAARSYLDFAIGKIRDHRGISASRSVEKLATFAWLLGRDDVIAEMDCADYAQYGAPKVKVFAEMLGWPWPVDDMALTRMAQGLRCHDGCDAGCGQ